VKDIVRKWSAVGEPVSTPWVEMNLEFVSPRAKDPPLSSRGYALMSVAVYDALVATWHYKYQYDRDAPDVGERLAQPGPDPSYPNEHAAIAGAASRVLAYLFPERPALRLDEAADKAADSRVSAGTNRRSDVEAGLELGRKVAEKVIAFAKADGAEKPCTKKVPGRAPRFWAPQPGSVANPVQPCAGEWKTWVMSAGNQFRPGPAPVFGSPQFLAQAREMVAVKNALTEDQKKAATFWAGGQGTPLPAGVWMNVLLAYLRNQLPTEPKAERTLALASDVTQRSNSAHDRREGTTPNSAASASTTAGAGSSTTAIVAAYPCGTAEADVRSTSSALSISSTRATEPATVPVAPPTGIPGGLQ
jgi:hypothetical protein